MKKIGDIIQLATKAGYFKIFTKAIAETGLQETLKESGPFTVFAPTDQAFAKLPGSALEDLLRQENTEKLRSLLKNHIVSGKYTAADLDRLERAKTLKGEEIRLDGRAGLWINDAEVLIADIEASNGILHAIDTVLIPQTRTATAS